jgi:F-type H+-transporting ATPase subunit gamma
MGNLKEIRQRIGSVKSTQQITKAMKMVAASKLRRAQASIVKIRPYANKIDGFLAELAEGIEDLNQNPYFQNRPADNILIIPITGDTGLCGAFNSYIINQSISLFQENKKRKQKVSVLVKKVVKPCRKEVSQCLTSIPNFRKTLVLMMLKTLQKACLKKFVDKDTTGFTWFIMNLKMQLFTKQRFSSFYLFL